MKILFQGDSITDSNRDYSDIHDLGDGYAHYAAGFISEKYPECTFEFVNQGINGNKTEDLLNRVQSDLVDIQPDIVSIMIGIMMYGIIRKIGNGFQMRFLRRDTVRF